MMDDAKEFLDRDLFKVNAKAFLDRDLFKVNGWHITLAGSLLVVLVLYVMFTFKQAE